MEGIQKVLPLYVFINEMQADGMTVSRLEATDNLDWYNSMMALHYTDDGMEAAALTAFGEERAVLFSESSLERTGHLVGIPSHWLAAPDKTSIGLRAASNRGPPTWKR